MNPGDGGYILLHRKLLDHSLVRQQPAAWFRVFVVLLLRVNWKPHKWWDGKQEITISAGQIVTSNQKLAEASGVSIKQVRLCLKYLERAGIAAIETAKGYTKITILNWDVYQHLNEPEGKPRGKDEGKPGAKAGQTEGKPAATIEEGKKGIIISREKQTDDFARERLFADHERAASGKTNPRISLKSDDDESTQLPENFTSPDDELKAIFLAKAGQHITIPVLDDIQSNLANAGIEMAEFVAELRATHLTGNWKNPSGFLRHLSKKFRSGSRKASPPVAAADARADVVVQPEDKCPECGCRRGQGLLLRDRKIIPCPCATPEYITQMRAKGKLPMEAVH